VDDDNAPLQERAGGLARSASETLQQAVDLLEGGDESDLLVMRGIDDVLNQLRKTIREIDNA